MTATLRVEKLSQTLLRLRTSKEVYDQQEICQSSSRLLCSFLLTSSVSMQDDDGVSRDFSCRSSIVYILHFYLHLADSSLYSLYWRPFCSEINQWTFLVSAGFELGLSENGPLSLKGVTSLTDNFPIQQKEVVLQSNILFYCLLLNWEVIRQASDSF